jgi:hypothetical protein
MADRSMRVPPEPEMPQGDFEAVFATADGIEQERWERAAARVRFEELRPVSAFPVIPGKRWGPGWWRSATTSGHVAHGSAAVRADYLRHPMRPGRIRR